MEIFLKRFWAIALLLLGGPAWAGFHMGLGRATAKKSVDVFLEAEETERRNSTGDNVALSMPPCGSDAPFTVLPIDLSTVEGFVPLGNLNPPGHTFPSDHTYFYIARSTPGDYTSPYLSFTLLAPGDITVSAVASSDYLGASPVVTDYAVYFYACRELKAYFFHVPALDPAFAAKVGPIDEQCHTYSTGGSSIRRCNKNVKIPMSAGEPIGYSLPTRAGLDFGAFDRRIAPWPFISPSRQYPERLYTVCPVDYFVPSLKSQLEARLGRYDGGVIRTQPPVCGTIMEDVASTAQGYWYKPGAPDMPEDPHLSLVHNGYMPGWGAISSGTSIAGLPAPLYFVPASSGTVNLDFDLVTPDGNAYCYDSFLDPLGQAFFLGYHVILQVTSATTLRIERKTSSSFCGSGPWSFGSAAVDFQR